MFENFVVLTEAVKLSSNIFWRMREVNYHDKLLDLIYNKQDVVTFGEVADLAEDKWLITKFISILDVCNKNDEKKWLENIFKVINYIDITAFNNTLLIYSSRNGFIDFVEYLFEKGADIHARDNLALKCAACNGRSKVVEFLLEKLNCKICCNQYIHLNIIHADDDYMLRCATEIGYLQVVKYLVENGANIHAKDDCALKWAVENGHLGVVNYLKMKMAN